MTDSISNGDHTNNPSNRHTTSGDTSEKAPPEQHDLRLKLRGLIADIIDGIELDPYRTDDRKVEARITIAGKQPLDVLADDACRRP